jgi:hypothetical protein
MGSKAEDRILLLGIVANHPDFSNKKRLKPAFEQLAVSLLQSEGVLERLLASDKDRALALLVANLSRSPSDDVKSTLPRFVEPPLGGHKVLAPGRPHRLVATIPSDTARNIKATGFKYDCYSIEPEWVSLPKPDFAIDSNGDLRVSTILDLSTTLKRNAGNDVGQGTICQLRLSFTVKDQTQEIESSFTYGTTKSAPQ